MLSAVIITYNEADRIEDCLRALACCDEVLVVDSHSTDNTRELATLLGARVIDRDWPGYRSQKEFAVYAAKHDWVLCLDADEVLTPALQSEIALLKSQHFPSYVGYSMPRALYYFGKFIRHGLTYPDRHVRLFNRQHGGWRGDEIHEYVAVTGSVGRLKGDLEHYAYRTLGHQIAKLEKYADLMARTQHTKGRRSSVFKIVFRPAWRFFSGFVLRGGFLDGWRGLTLSLVEANYVRQKYLKLFLLNRGFSI